jgi:HEAT repeat protein
MTGACVPLPLLLATLALGACGTPGLTVPVDVEDAPVPGTDLLVAREVGRLLTADPELSAEAERRLTTLDEAGRRALLAHAARIPSERDPRWLHVLDENHALGPLPPQEEVAYLLWKVTRDEPVYVRKAQGRLLEMARAEPDVLLRTLSRAAEGADEVGLALALAGEERAVPLLLDRYEGTESVEVRRASAESLSRLVGDDLRPRVTGSRAGIRRDAEAIRAWWRARERTGGGGR